MKRRKRGSKPHRMILANAMLVLMCLLTACSSGDKGESSKTTASSEAVVQSEQGSSSGQVEYTLKGTVEDSTMSTLTVAAENGQSYVFQKEGIEIKTGQSGILIGNPVAVTYCGDLDEGKTQQDVRIITIEVEDAAVSSQEATSQSSSDPDKTIQNILDKMTLEEKVGQMFIARCPEKGAVQKVKEYHLGGYILFARDFEDNTKEQVKETIQSYQKQSDIPMLIGVDEEGGTVNRISRYPAFRAEPFSSPQELYKAGGFEAIEKDTVEKCTLLHELGVNLNFAPVCDVSKDPEDFIYNRSFGKDASQTAQYVTTVVDTMKEQKIVSVLKHFPGYGDNEDTHTGIAYDNRSYDDFVQSDFIPFEAGIDSGADVVLVSHNIVKSMDDQRPASLSPRVHEILREELGFSGVIVTDDLYMDGVRDFADDEQVAVMAVEAGNDLLCCTDFTVQIPAVVDAVKSGEIPEHRIDQSVIRILEMKRNWGLL